MDIASLAIQVKTGDVQKGVKELDKLTDAGKDAEKATHSLAIASGIAAGAITASLFAIGRASVQAAIEAENASNKMQAVLKATGHSAGLTKEQLDDMADSMAASTRFDDESIRNASAVLLTFRNVQGDTFRQGISLAADLASVLGTDLNSASLQLGKALQDPVQGITALSRAGIQFSEVQKDQIKKFVETNQLAKAQDMILGELRSQVGGTAEAMNTGLTKATSDLKKAMDELFESIGKSKEIQVGVTGFAGGLSTLFTELKLRVDDTGSSIKGLASFIAGNSQIAQLLGLSEGQMTGRPKASSEIDDETRRLANRSAALGAERQRQQQAEDARLMANKKQAEEDAKRNKSLIEEGRKGWIELADEIFKQADDENQQMAKLFDDLNAKEQKAREEDTAGWVRAYEEREDLAIKLAQAEMQQRKKQQAEEEKASKEFTKDLESDLKGAFMMAFQASKNPAEAFVTGLANSIFSRVSASLASALADAAIKKATSSSSSDLFGSLISMGASYFGGGTAVNGTTDINYANFEGGGFTGSGTRSGGTDGKGGFMAVLHPNETVIDHTKGGGGGSSIIYSPVINVDSRTDRGEVMRIINQAVQNGNAKLVDSLQRSGRL